MPFTRKCTAIESGAADRQNNLLKNAPHTADMVAADNWDRPYPRESGGVPGQILRDYKFWPASAAWTMSYGDRNPVCTCVGMENYTVEYVSILMVNVKNRLAKAVGIRVNAVVYF